jgi:L-cysteine S-thiosulfotransferase
MSDRARTAAVRCAAAVTAAAGLGGLLAPGVSQAEATPTVVPWQAVGDTIPQPLTSSPPSADRGRQIVLDRRTGLCLLCHTLPGHGPQPEARFQGNLAPSLAGAGSRWNAAQLRLRVADSRQLNPASLMPAFHRLPSAARVGSNWQGQPVLSAQQVEDVVAFLETLQ